MKNLKNRFIHLTNDAVQKKSEDYGKYENANKISFADFEKYLESNFQDKDYSFYANVYPKMMVRPSLCRNCQLMPSDRSIRCSTAAKGSSLSRYSVWTS